MDLFRGLLECPHNMAPGSPRGGDPGGRRGEGGKWGERERERELEQGESHTSFNDQDLEVTHFPIYHILFIRSESLNRAHIKGKALHSTFEERRIKKCVDIFLNYHWQRGSR